MWATPLAVLVAVVASGWFDGACARPSFSWSAPLSQNSDNSREAVRVRANGLAARRNSLAEGIGRNSKSLDGSSTRKPVPVKTAQATASGSCQSGDDVKVGTEVDPAGLARLSISAPCHANEAFSVEYGRYAFGGKLNGDGDGVYTLDLFLGAQEPIAVSIPGGPKTSVPAPDVDLRGLSKVALVWRPDINLDLHALEYLAKPGSPGHVWPGMPASLTQAREAVAGTKKGHGFISSSSDGTDDGDKADVYTFVHEPKQHSGIVSLFVDYETRAKEKRPDTCGNGANARMHFDIVRLSKGKTVKREKILIAPLACDADLGGKSRYLRYGIRDMRVR